MSTQPESTYKDLQRWAKKRLRMALVPPADSIRWKDSKGRCYERLPNGQIVKVSA